MKYILRGLFLCVILIVFSCSMNKKTDKPEMTYTFQKENAVEFVDSMLPISKEIVLDTTIVAPLTNYTNIQLDRNRIFCYGLSYVYEYDKDGHFICKIGEVGHGKGEYIQAHGVTLNKQDEVVEVLDNQEIYRYNYNGRFISKEQIDAPFSNFVYNDGYYWFSSDNNDACGDYTLYKYDNTYNRVDWICERKTDFCVGGSDFGKGTIITYHNVFSHDIYQIVGSKAVFAYTLKFPGLEIPKSFYKADITTITNEMKNNNFALIRTFIENEQYIFMLVHEYKSGNMESAYYWIIDKTQQEECIVKLDTSNDDVYYLNPQVLDKDNILYFVGCRNNANVGVYGVDLKLLFDKINNKQ